MMDKLGGRQFKKKAYLISPSFTYACCFTTGRSYTSCLRLTAYEHFTTMDFVLICPPCVQLTSRVLGLCASGHYSSSPTLSDFGQTRVSPSRSLIA